VSTDTAGKINVLVLGEVPSGWSQQIELVGVPESWETGYHVEVRSDEEGLAEVLATRLPHAIVTIGSLESFPLLASESIDVRRRWIHFDEVPIARTLAHQLTGVFVDVATRDRFPTEPLVSVFTPTYLSGEMIRRTYESLRRQHYRNWEWVVYDDSPDTATFDIVAGLAEHDHRIRLFRSDRPCGVIGEVKRRCTGLAKGAVLLELDHDDRLTARCLGDVVAGFRAFPDAGFVYTDCAEVFEDGENAVYPHGYAFGFGSYRTEDYDGHTYMVSNYPSINSKTVRHIVGVPNHVRAWSRAGLTAAGGYASEVHVADDYELLLRTFLRTRMVHVRRFGYIQTMSRSTGNTHRRRNREIQRLVALFAHRYEEEIHARFEELGVDDFIWTPSGLDWSIPNPDPTPIANYVLA